MTPTTIKELARQRYNAIGDNFFSDDELNSYIYAACMELSAKSKCIRRVYTTSTVANTQEYSKPTNTVSIKRITYNGYKLNKITMREDDALTIHNQATTATGTPCHYFEWSDSIFLRPTPAAVGTLKIFSYNQPQEVTNTSTIEVPERYHIDLVDYMLEKMVAKDQNFDAASYHGAEWNKKILDAIKFEKMAIRGDSFTSVQDIDLASATILGVV